MENENLPLAEDIGMSADELNANPGLADLGTEAKPQQETQAEAPPKPEPEKPPQHVPLSELLETRKAMQEEKAARQNMERMLSQLLAQQQHANQPKAPDIPDIFENPDARIDYRARQQINPIQQALSYNSKLVAKAIYGDEVEAAEKAFNEAVASGAMDDATYYRINSSPNPFKSATHWYRQQKVLTETGGDLRSYEEKLLSNPEFLKRAAEAYAKQAQPTKQQQQPIVQVPSLARTERGDVPLSKEQYRAMLRE